MSSDAIDAIALKRAYEIGRARVAVTRAFVAAIAVAIAASLAASRAAAPWAIASFVVLAFLEWRGGALARGGWRGFVAGLAALAIPMSVLRPCCDAAKMSAGNMSGTVAACCTMPAMCGASGVVVGLVMSLAWPRESSPRSHALAGVGVALGALSVVTARCVGLFAGEAVGLALGLAAGIAASGAARAWLSNRASRV